MARRSGFLQYFEWSQAGQNSYAVPGKITGGSYSNDGVVSYATAQGGISDMELGIVVPSGSVEFDVTDTSSGLIAYAFRSSYTSALSGIDVQCGTSLDGYKHATAYVNRLRLSSRVGGRLSATVEWQALTPSTIAVPTWAARDTAAPFQWFDGVCTIGGAAYSLQDFSVDMNNNCQAYSSLDQGSAGSLRLPEEILGHDESVTARATIAVPLSPTGLGEPWADYPGEAGTLSLAFTDANSNTCTIALGNASLNSWEMPFVTSKDVVLWTCNFVCKVNDTGSFDVTFA